MGREPGLDRKPNLKLSVWSRIQTSTPTSSMRRPPSSSPQERHHEDLIAYDACKPHTKKKLALVSSHFGGVCAPPLDGLLVLVLIGGVVLQSRGLVDELVVGLLAAGRGTSSKSQPDVGALPGGPMFRCTLSSPEASVLDDRCLLELPHVEVVPDGGKK